MNDSNTLKIINTYINTQSHITEKKKDNRKKFFKNIFAQLFDRLSPHTYL